MEKVVAAVDWGGTKVLAGLVSSSGSVLSSRRIPTPRGGPEEVLRKATDLLEETAREMGLSLGDLPGIGLTVPRRVRPGSGILAYAPAHQLTNVPVEQLLASLARIPVIACNDSSRTNSKADWYVWADLIVNRLSNMSVP